MSKTRSILSLLALLLFILGGARAQQAPIFTNYTNSYAYINPGYAGLSEGVNLLGLYRQQWAGYFVDEQGNSLSPTTFLLTGDMPIRALGGGISFSVMNDKLGFENNINVGLGYSYHLDMGGSTLGIGASATLINRSLDFSKLIFGTTGDPLQLNDERSAMMFDVSAGLFWQIPESFYIGISGINLLETTTRALGDDDNGASFTTDRTFYAVAGYPFVIETLPIFKFVPSVAVMSDLASTQLNAGMKVIYSDAFSLGVNYRPQESVGITVGLAFKDFVLGYAYDINTMGFNIKGSHEVAISYCFKLDTDRTPRDYRSVRYL